MKKFNLKEEEICGYTVSKEMKQVWNIELEIVKKIDKICKENKINYTLCGGSLLGAIRHKGFIPWDDDIDIAMLRNDYEKFLEIAKKEFKKPYFVQDYRTEKNYYYGHAQIRNSNTTAFILGDEMNEFNHGIFVDIFPFDNLPDNLIKRFFFVKKISHIKKDILRIIYQNKSHGIKYILKKIYIKVFCLNKKKLINKLNKIVTKYNKKRTKQVGAIGFKPEDFSYETSWFEKYEYLDFENFQFKCTKDYDEWLTRQYGNYMLIPKNKNGSSHGTVYFDPQKKYTEYNKNIIIKKMYDDLNK